MIISFDGNVYAGKTSLIDSLAQSGNYAVLKEHSSFLATSKKTSSFDTEVGVQNEQQRYLDAEALRTSHLEANKDTLIDRSFVSMAAHVYALLVIKGIDIRKWFLLKMGEGFESNKILVPDLFVILRCDPEVILERINKDNRRRTEGFYFSNEYMDAVSAFDQKWCEAIGGMIFDSTSFSVVELTETFFAKADKTASTRLSDPAILKHLIELLYNEHSDPLAIPESDRDPDYLGL